jgi:hypothetical protein
MMHIQQIQGGGQFTLVDNADFNKSGLVEYETRKALVLLVKAKFLDGTKMPYTPGKTRRQLLADFITKSPYFGKAFVNRMWGHFFGISFTRDGVADFGEHNPVSHPDLLDKLAEDWTTKYRHNPKDLIRWICNSKAYGLSSIANKTTASRESERFFARMLLKPMTPEQLFESLSLATQPQLLLNTDEQKTRKETWLQRLVVNFGNDEGEEATFNGTVVQALLLMNGRDINEAISDPKGAVELALQRNGRIVGNNFALNHQGVISYLFLAGLNRLPTQKEITTITSANTFNLPGTKVNNANEVRNFWKGYYEDVLWAMVNSNEFFLNH